MNSALSNCIQLMGVKLMFASLMVLYLLACANLPVHTQASGQIGSMQADDRDTLSVMLPTEEELPGTFFIRERATSEDSVREATTYSVCKRGMTSISKNAIFGYSNARQALSKEQLAWLAKLPLEEIKLIGGGIQPAAVQAFESSPVSRLALEFSENEHLAASFASQLVRMKSLSELRINSGIVQGEEFYTELAGTGLASLSLAFLDGASAPSGWLGSFRNLRVFRAMRVPGLRSDSLRLTPQSVLEEIEIDAGFVDYGVYILTFDFLSTFQRVKRLQLKHIEFTAAAVSARDAFGEMKSLCDVTLHSCYGLVPDDLALLPDGNLESMHVSHVSGSFRKLIAGMHRYIKLKNVKLWACEDLSEAAFGGGTAPKSLETFTVHECPLVRGPNVVRFLSTARVKHLEMTRIGLAKGTFQGGGLDTLESIVLKGSKGVDGTVIAILAKLPYLRVLDISSCDAITSDALNDVAKMRALEMLNIGHLEAVVDDHLFLYAKELASLREITLNDCHQVTGDGLIALARLPLRYVSIRFLSCVDDRVLERLSKLEHLAVIDITGCTELSRKGIAEVMSGNTKLKVIGAPD